MVEVKSSEPPNFLRIVVEVKASEPPNFLKIVVEVKASEPPNVLKIWSEVSKEMLQKYFCPNKSFFVSVEFFVEDNSVSKCGESGHPQHLEIFPHLNQCCLSVCVYVIFVAWCFAPVF